MQCFNFISESSSEVHAQKFFHDNLTLPKSTEKCCLERDLNSHLRAVSGYHEKISVHVSLRMILKYYTSNGLKGTPGGRALIGSEHIGTIEI